MFVQENNVATTTVAHLIDVNVVWQDAAEIVVAPGGTNRVPTCLVTNTGNAGGWRPPESVIARPKTLP